jgi:predicted MFS family arabinose efflux permease
VTATPTTSLPTGDRSHGSSGSRRQAGLNVVILTIAVACGLTVANLYYAQPLLVLMARTFSVSQGTAAIVVTATQLGYAAGLAFVVPLGDVLENRKLACRTLLITTVALAVAALSPDFTLFLVMSVCIGVTSVIVQVLVPFAAHLAPADQRGKYVSRVMSGLLLGILLARSLASVTAAAWGWRSIYLISAGAMLALALVLWRILPERRPGTHVRYESCSVRRFSSSGRSRYCGACRRPRRSCSARSAASGRPSPTSSSTPITSLS